MDFDFVAFTAICGSVFFFSIPFLLIGFLRYLRYKETLVLAEKGLLHESYTQRNGNKRTLRTGVIVTAIGSALCLGLWPIGFYVDNSFLGLGPWMLPGLIPAFFGASLLVLHYLGAGDSEQELEASIEIDDVPPHKMP